MNKLLRTSRKKRGLSIVQAANDIGISYSMLEMLELKKRNGGDKTKIKVANYYGLSVQELFYS